MNRVEAQTRTLQLMDEFGLRQRGWEFKWDKTRKTLGRCFHGLMEIRLSVHYVDNNDWDVMDQVARHEIAHALAGYEAAHGPEWQAIAIQCGVTNPSAVCRNPDIKSPEGRYQAVCETCGHRYHRHKITRNMNGGLACRVCCAGTFDSRYALTFRDTYKSVTVAPRTPENVSVSVQQSAPSVSVPNVPAGSPNSFSAPQVAAAMGVDAKRFRAWLRKYAVGRNFQQGPGGSYVFTPEDVKNIVAAWNATH